jgi:hypothetical protein
VKGHAEGIELSLVQPSPDPAINRRPDIRSFVASILTAVIGLRYDQRRYAATNASCVRSDE